jgi:hypothetical protein
MISLLYGDTDFTLQERKTLSNQVVVVDRILPVGIIEELNLIKPMATAPTMKHVGFTVPPPMEKELEQMAKEEHRTKSDLFREMVRVYRSYRKRHPEPEIDDAWAMQVIREAQEEQERNPMTPDELVAEFKELACEGGRQAKQLGITEEDIDTIIREERHKRKTTNRS